MGRLVSGALGFCSLFLAEVGIRAWSVTGVQACARPFLHSDGSLLGFEICAIARPDTRTFGSSWPSSRSRLGPRAHHEREARGATTSRGRSTPRHPRSLVPGRWFG